MMGKATRVKRVSYEEAMAELPALDARLAEASAAYSAEYEAALAAYRRLQRVMASSGAKVVSLRQRRTRLLAVVNAGPSDNPIERAQVENPRRSDNQVAHEIEMTGEGKSDLIEVDKNMAVLIGGLFRVGGRSEVQTLAAARYRDIYDTAQLGGAKAIDYTAVRVDTSGSSHVALADMGEDARRLYGLAVARLGQFKSSLIERVVCDGMSIREVARRVENNEGDAARRRITGHLLLALDEVAEILGVGQGRRRGKINGSGAQVPIDWQGTAAGQQAKAA